MNTGSISTGTLRPKDLIPRFVEHLQMLLETQLRNLIENPPADFDYQWDTAIGTLKGIGRLERDMDYDSFFDEDDLTADFEWLDQKLNDYAPAGHYFGAHPGDGADFGFWPCTED